MVQETVIKSINNLQIIIKGKNISLLSLNFFYN